jgi:signal transduction histidine kinase
MNKRRLQIVMYIFFILAYLGFLLYFLTIRPGGANGNIYILWAMTAFASGGMLIMAIYAVTHYFFLHGEKKTALYFALICAASCIRFFVMEGSLTIIGLIPEFSLTSALFIRYFFIGLTVIGVTGFIYEMFAKPKHKKLFIIFISLTFISFTMGGSIGALRGGESLPIRFSLSLLTLVVNICLVTWVAQSPDLHKNKLNRFYLAVVIAYVSSTVVNTFLTGWFPHFAIFTNMMLAIVHLVLLSDRYARTISENELLERLSTMKSDLMTTISHETRTPLAVISSYTELIAMELRTQGVNEQHAKDLDTVSDEIQNIAGLIEEMQNFSRFKNEYKEKILTSLTDLISQITRLYSHILERHETKLIIEVPETLPLVYINPGKLSQVFYNLLQNTRNHTRGGEVTVTARMINNGTFIEMSVSDTGEGIPPDLLPRVFQRGVTGRDSSMGMGLAVCKEIIMSVGGEIRIESDPGKGTVVRFTLPVAEIGKNHEQ